ncbi:MAG: SDR family NAD(P)-dependent oxidoreductase [Actinomycetota bacterium]|nr:SDR family NAD(P)-dependent oxidoreductase [Acidimicrobiia bacterium]MDQ3294110.1 SDR family NAD(P)-dependent oxidoreductase [Actinomycetota bacterium]
MELAGKVAVVTGGASGIGAATAARLAEAGCRVVVVDVQDGLGAEQAAAVDGRYVRADVSDPAAWLALVDDVVAVEGAIDVAHLNAGVVTGAADITELTDAQYDRIMGVNVHGVVYGLRAVARVMAGSGGGIVATASVAGVWPFALDPIYTLTKHAVVGLVRSVAPGLDARGITVNAVCPGVVDTPLVGEARELLRGAGFPMIPPSLIADGVVGALTSGRTGECWVCLPDRDPAVFEFAAPDLADIRGGAPGGLLS